MKNFTRIVLIACVISSFSACKKKSEEVKPEENAVVHGKVYSKNFTMVTGRANNDISLANGAERVVVNLSANSNFNCSNPENSGYSVYFRVPKKVGTYTRDKNPNELWLGFNDDATENSIGFVSADCMIEIKSLSNGRVSGKISFADQSTDSDVSGTFDVPFCQ